MKCSHPLTAAILLCLIAASIATAAVPNLMPYQGRLTNLAGSPLAGTYSVQFSLYSVPAGGVADWQETQSITSNADGLFTALLGAVTPIGFYAFSDTNRYLGVKVGADPELTPRARLASSPYAMRVHTVDSAYGGFIYGATEVEAPGFGLAVTGNSLGNHPSGLGNAGFGGAAYNSPVRNLGVIGEAGPANPAEISAGVLGYSSDNLSPGLWAGYFDGHVNVTGNFTAAAKSFRIDDPTSPSDRTLQHACVESDQYKNVYDGITTTDADGNATVTLPDWTGALNTDFRYQLTCVGQFAQVIISDEIAGNQFSIKSDRPNVKVSWQVTGVRKDPYVLAHPLEVQQAKPDALVGKYLHPAEYGLGQDAGIDYATRKLVEDLRTNRTPAVAE